MYNFKIKLVTQFFVLITSIDRRIINRVCGVKTNGVVIASHQSQCNHHLPNTGKIIQMRLTSPTIAQRIVHWQISTSYKKFENQLKIANSLLPPPVDFSWQHHSKFCVGIAFVRHLSLVCLYCPGSQFTKFHDFSNKVTLLLTFYNLSFSQSTYNPRRLDRYSRYTISWTK